MYREPSDRDHDIYHAITFEGLTEKAVREKYQISGDRLNAILRAVADWLVCSRPFDGRSPRESAICSLKIRLNDLRTLHAEVRKVIRVWNKQFLSGETRRNKPIAKAVNNQPCGGVLMPYFSDPKTAKTAGKDANRGLKSLKSPKGSVKVTKTRLRDHERWLRLADDLSEKIAKAELAMLRLRFGKEEVKPPHEVAVR